MVKPYTQTYDNGVIIRQFDEDVNDDELIWHRDKRTREITILEGDGWIINPVGGVRKTINTVDGKILVA